MASTKALPNFTAKDSKQNRLLRIFFGADLRSGHKGLYEQATTQGFKVDSLGVGEFICFVNRRKNAVKMFASGRDFVGYYKSPHGALNMKVLRSLPRYFNGGELRYPEALRETILKEVRTQ
jgi:hypothetical protein